MEERCVDVSLIMPVYNASRYLNESINSVLLQSYEDFEFIIIDDGSEDNSFELISEFKDHRIKLVQNPHNYIMSLNLGFKMARGKYIVRMDADDIMYPDRLKNQVEFMEKYPEVDVSGTWMEVFGDGINPYIAKIALNHQEICALALLSSPLFNPTVIIRNTPKLRELLSYEDSFIYAEDYRLWTVLLMNGCNFANQSIVLHKYRRNEDQVSNVKREYMKKSFLLARIEYVEHWLNFLCDKNDFQEMVRAIMNSYQRKDITFETLSKLIYPLVSIL